MSVHPRRLLVLQSPWCCTGNSEYCPSEPCFTLGSERLHRAMLVTAQPIASLLTASHYPHGGERKRQKKEVFAFHRHLLLSSIGVISRRIVNCMFKAQIHLALPQEQEIHNQTISKKTPLLKSGSSRSIHSE